MKTRVTLALLAIGLALTAGCESAREARIRRNPHVYAQLDPEAQYNIQQGIIDLGYTPDMVYLALGAPDERRETLTADGVRQTWTYSTYYERYEGTRHVGYERQVYFDRHRRRYRIHYEPVFADTYSPQRDERIRVDFVNGRVTSVEQVR
ncbi:MAG TPA: hypothetical protein VEB66_09100 [Opitutaceae bacterium]|nr:hypothetical protein [Opitutaceae bacterium]